MNNIIVYGNIEDLSFDFNEMIRKFDEHSYVNVNMFDCHLRNMIVNFSITIEFIEIHDTNIEFFGTDGSCFYVSKNSVISFEVEGMLIKDISNNIYINTTNI